MTSRKLSLSAVALCFVVVVSFALPVFTETPSNERVAAASCQRCGDGYCAQSCENERTCPADCRSTKLAAPAPVPAAPALAAASRCGRCGDGQCVKSCGETATSCPVDCGGGGEPSAASTSTGKAAPCEAEKPQDVSKDQ